MKKIKALYILIILVLTLSFLIFGCQAKGTPELYESNTKLEQESAQSQSQDDTQETEEEVMEDIDEEIVPEEETPEIEEVGSQIVINVIEITDPLSGVVYDALATDVAAEWMNQLATSCELQFHLEVSDPGGEYIACWLSDSLGNNYESIPADNGSIDFYWTSPVDTGELTMKFLIKDNRGMETVKELNFTFIEY